MLRDDPHAAARERQSERERRNHARFYRSHADDRRGIRPRAKRIEKPHTIQEALNISFRKGADHDGR